MIQSRKQKWRWMFRPMMMVGLLVFIIYLPALHNQFVNWDDNVHLTANYFIQTPQEHFLSRIFTTTVNGIYIPLTSLSFAVEHYFFGNEPFIYHLNNVLLHTAVSMLVIPLAAGLGLTIFEGMIAALIFGLHPIHVESVAWVTERKDVLFALFYLLGLLAYLKYVSLDHEKNGNGILQKWSWLALTLVLGVLSALSKPMAMSFPLILAICDIYLRRKFNIFVILEKILIGLVLLPIACLTYQSQAHEAVVPLVTSALLWMWSFGFYLYKFFMMDFFVLIYKLPQPISYLNPTYFVSAAGFILIIIVCIANRRNRLFLFALMFYLCSIFLILRWDFLKDINAVADRFMYLPCLGICLWLGNAIGSILLKKNLNEWFKKFFTFIIIAVLILMMIKTNQQILVWKNSVTLWEHQLVHQPQAATALTYNKLASAYADEMNLNRSLNLKGYQNLSAQEREQYQRILSLYQKSLLIKPDYADSYYRLAKIYNALGVLNEYEDYLKKTVLYDPDHFEAYLDLGEIYLSRGDRALAIDLFLKAIALNPENENVKRRVNGFLH